ncbi:MAG: hypothetical protein ABIQ65_05045 [Thermoanaerobaculia bacterium]
MFDFLTAHVWEGGGCGQGGMFPPTCVTLSFDRGGHFSWRAVSDYTERDEKGGWNFRLRDTDSGTLTLENGSVLAIERRGERLMFGGSGFVAAPGDAIAPTEQTVAGLPSVVPSALYESLVGSSWSKTNPFDVFYEPDRFLFSRDGTLRASYRGGECEHGGTFSLDGKNLIRVNDPNACDVRGSVFTTFVDTPVMTGELLTFFQSSYRPGTEPADPKIFIHDGYQNTLALRGEYEGELSRGVATDLRLTFNNEGTRVATLTGLEISMRTLSMGQGSLSSSDPFTVLLTRSYHDYVEVGGGLSETVGFSPSDSGEYIELQVTWQFSDEQQSYRSVLGLVGAVR